MAEQFLRIGGTDGTTARAVRTDKNGNIGMSLQTATYKNKQYQAVPVNINHDHIINQGINRNYGGDIRASVSDLSYVYIGGVTGSVEKLKKSDLTPLATTPYGSAVASMSQDTQYIYVGRNDGLIKKFNKADMSEVATSPNYGGIVYAMAQDSEFIYAVGSVARKVIKYRKTDMSLVSASSITFTGDLYSIAVNSSYVVVGGATNGEVAKLNKSDLSKVADFYYATGRSIIFDIDNDHFYIAGNAAAVEKRRISDLGLVLSESYGGVVRVLAQQGNYLFVAGNAGTVLKMDKETFEIVAESEKYNGNIRVITADENFIFFGGETSGILEKHIHILYENLYWGATE